ncbi:hypothetical protein ACJX0J_031567 [Zea mays]
MKGKNFGHISTKLDRDYKYKEKENTRKLHIRNKLFLESADILLIVCVLAYLLNLFIRFLSIKEDRASLYGKRDTIELDIDGVLFNELYVCNDSSVLLPNVTDINICKTFLKMRTYKNIKLAVALLAQAQHTNEQALVMDSCKLQYTRQDGRPI